MADITNTKKKKLIPYLNGTHNLNEALGSFAFRVMYDDVT